jgi:hypothetical protein
MAATLDEETLAITSVLRRTARISTAALIGIIVAVR